MTVSTSDESDPVQTVNLEANGGGAPFCQLKVVPESQEPGVGGLFDVPAPGRDGVVEFGPATVFVPKRSPITFENIGNADCSISDIAYDNETNTLDNEFRLETDAGAPAVNTSATVAPGSVQTYYAVFEPTHTVESSGISGVFDFGSYSAANGEHLCGFLTPNAKCNGVAFTTNDFTSTRYTNGITGLVSIGFEATPVAPIIDVIPGELDFGVVTLDCGSPAQRVTIYNNGGANLRVGEPGIDPLSNPAVFVVEGTTNFANSLRNVPETVRPLPMPPDPDYDPATEHALLAAKLERLRGERDGTEE